MKGYRLELIRHGITSANLEGRYIGTTDTPLCEEGTMELYKKLDEYEYPYIQRVYCSPLKRCRQTAAILYPNAPIMEIGELREMDFGKFENMKADELLDNADYKKFMQGGMDTPPPDGEPMSSVIERCYTALAKILANMMNEGLTNCAVVTHGGIIMNMLSCFGMPKIPPAELSCDFGEGFEILISASMWQRSNCFEILGRIPFLKEDDYDQQ
ncbi:MAG: histidine phosphatase family protein [Ruminococcus sp.]|nr:histidine phosphatase family protein [Ruminococcus sp.]